MYEILVALLLITLVVLVTAGIFHFLKDRDEENEKKEEEIKLSEERALFSADPPVVASNAEPVAVRGTMFENESVPAIPEPLVNVMGEYEPQEVEKYYDDITNKYLEIYGEVIQAFRPSSTVELLDYTLQSCGMQNGQQVLDAGCGVGGPAMHFASKLDVKIEGVTISGVQVEKGNELIQERGLQDRVLLKKGDFHFLEKIVEEAHFDLALFLESLGHAKNAPQVIKSAHKVLKEGGFIYIKDFFKREVEDPELAKKNARVVQLMNQHYNYNVLELHATLTALRLAGFHIVFIKRPEFENDVRIRTEFETDQKIDLWDGQDEWLPVEWLEIKCQKLWW